MRGDPGGDDSFLHILQGRQTEMLRRRHVAEEIRPRRAGDRAADGRGDVVVAGRDVRRQRPQHVEGRAVAEVLLQQDIRLDVAERHVARPFDHHLDALFPGPLCQLSQGDQFLHLPPVRRVGQASRPQAVPQAQNHLVTPGDVQEAVVVLVERVFPAVAGHPVGQDGAAAADDAQDPALLLDGGRALPRHAAVDGDEVHAVLAVFLDDPEEVVRRHLGDRRLPCDQVDDGLVDGHGPHDQRRSRHDRLTDSPDVSARGEVHDRIRPRRRADAHLLQFEGRIGLVLGRPDVRIDLGPHPLADGERRDRPMPSVPADDDRPVLDAPPDIFRRHALLFGTEAHLFRNRARAGAFQLRLHFPLLLFAPPFFSARIISAAFRPDRSIPPKTGPMRGPPKAAFADIPAT